MYSTKAELDLMGAKAYSEANDSKFMQQTLDVWQPKMHKYKSILCCSIIGVIMLVVGGGMYVSISGIVATDPVYYHTDVRPDCSIGSSCTVLVSIEKEMKPPVYVYYRINNFFQNHRQFVISRDERQLRDLSIASPQTCTPLKLYGDLSNKIGFEVPNSTETDKVLYPCGLPAVTAFSDELSACVTPSGGSACDPLTGDDWLKDGIAAPSDAQHKYIYDPNYDTTVLTRANPRGGTIKALDDEDLVVWMRHAATSDFYKLHRQITTRTLNEGDVFNVTVYNDWDPTPFNGEKGIVLVTQHLLGGKNQAISVAWMLAGAVCLASAVYIALLTRFCEGYVSVK